MGVRVRIGVVAGAAGSYQLEERYLLMMTVIRAVVLWRPSGLPLANLCFSYGYDDKPRCAFPVFCPGAPCGHPAEAV